MAGATRSCESEDGKGSLEHFTEAALAGGAVRCIGAPFWVPLTAILNSYGDNPMSEQAHSAHADHPKNYHFFVDGKKYEVEQASLTGADIKRIADVNPGYQLFLETEGDDPDQPIADSTAVDLTHGAKHFFAVPPATFGAQ